MGFLNFRKAVASHVGYSLRIDDNFKWIKDDWKNWDKYWLLFLTHSDCSGYFTPLQCGEIAERLEKVLHDWESLGNPDLYLRFTLKNLRELVRLMTICKDKNLRMRIS